MKPTGLSRKVYDDDYCYAVLELEQSVKGYTLVIPKKHYETILDSSIDDVEIIQFWRVVQKIGNAIKATLGAENVYVCSLCDGIKHFHVHLIPRYPWTDEDKNRYSELFTERDGEQSVKLCTTIGRIGGFWYLADTERNFKEIEFAKLSIEEQQKAINDTAKVIALCLK